MLKQGRFVNISPVRIRTFVMALAGVVAMSVLVPLVSGGAANASPIDLAAIPRGSSGDYLVTVGKRTVWASEVARQKALQRQRRIEASRAARPGTLVPVTVGRQTHAVPAESGQATVVPPHKAPAAFFAAAPLGAGQSRLSTAASSEKPEKSSPEKRSRGYFEKRGRATFWVPYP